MVDVSRRLFLGGALALSAATILSREVVASETVPTLYGDGVHDDTAALQAMLDQRPVIIEGEAVRSEGTIYLRSGIYLISRPLVITKDGTAFIGDGGQIKTTLDFDYDAIIIATNRRDITLMNLHVTGPKRDEWGNPVRPSVAVRIDGVDAPDSALA